MFTATIAKRVYKTKKRRKNVSWFYQIELPKGPDGARRRIFKSGFDTESAAKEAAAEAIGKLAEASDVMPSDVTVGQYLARWIAQHVTRNLAPKTADRYRELVQKYIVPALGAVELQKLTALQLEQFYAGLREHGSLRNRDGATIKGLSWKTVRHVHGLLHGAFNTAVRWKFLSSNPAGRVELPKAPKMKAACPDSGCVEFIVATLVGTPMFVPAVIAAYTGARRGEILALRWQDIDFDNRVLRLTRSLEQVGRELRFKETKTGEPRVLPMPAVLIESLHSHQQDQERNRQAFGEDYHADLDLVVCQPDGAPLFPDSFTAAYCSHVRKIGKPGISFHKLRHAHASILLSKGVPVTAVSKRLGHSTVSTTLNVYSHAFGSDELRAADTIDQVFGPGQKELKGALRQ